MLLAGILKIPFTWAGVSPVVLPAVTLFKFIPGQATPLSQIEATSPSTPSVRAVPVPGAVALKIVKSDDVSGGGAVVLVRTRLPVT